MFIPIYAFYYHSKNVKRERLFGCYKVLENALNQRKKLSIPKTDIGDEKKNKRISIFLYSSSKFFLYSSFIPIVKTRNQSFREKSFRIHIFDERYEY